MLRFLPMPCLKVIENYNILKEMAVDQVSQHKNSWVPGEPRDLIDCYLDEMEKVPQYMFNHNA